MWRKEMKEVKEWSEQGEQQNVEQQAKCKTPDL